MPDEPYVMPSWEDAAQVDTVTTAGTSVPCIGSWINIRVCERGTKGCEVVHGAETFRRVRAKEDEMAKKGGVVIELKTFAQNQEELMRRWAVEYEEWRRIGAGMVEAAGPTGFVSAHDVTAEQRRRMSERGETSVLESAFAKLALGL